MAAAVHFALFISRLMAPMAAKQGAQRRLKIMKEYAAMGPKSPAMRAQMASPLSPSSSPAKL